MRFFLWFVYYPILKILTSLFFWQKKVGERRRFERKNGAELLAQSFQLQGLKADICFEFSSEGEYQQVASLIDDALRAGKKLELIFFSPSVEKTILKLAAENRNQIRYFRYPLLTFSPFGISRSMSRWATAKQLIMVRYDLFPEFLVWSKRKGNELILLWATFKKERVRNKKVSWYKRKFFQAAKRTIFASIPDQKLGYEIGFTGPMYDFRMEQIRRRIALRDEKFKNHFPKYAELKSIWDKFPSEKRIIIGNAWPSDLFLLKSLPEDFFALIVPHQLHPEMIEAFERGLETLGRKPQVVTDESSVREGKTILLNKKGVLCELYADFKFAYVGGGFETSVHSILEPLVAGSNAISCGPIHFRSTEFDVAQEFNRMTEVKDAEEFKRWLSQDKIKISDSVLKGVFEKYEEYRKDVISC